MKKHLYLISTILICFMMSGCSGKKGGSFDGHGGTDSGNKTRPRAIFTAPVNFRVLTDDTNWAYSGVEYAQSFDTDDFYVAEEASDSDGIPERIIKKVGIDNIPKVLCDKSDCRHIHNDCDACMGGVNFTVNGKFYSIESANSDYGQDKSYLYRIGENGIEKTDIDGLPEISDIRNTEFFTDGSDVFYLDIENDALVIKKLELATAKLSNACTLYGNVNSVINIPFEDGVERKCSIKNTETIKTEYIPADGSYIVFSFDYLTSSTYNPTINARGRMYAKYNVAEKTITYLNANSESCVNDFVQYDNVRYEVQNGILFKIRETRERDTDDFEIKNISYRPIDGDRWIELPEIAGKYSGKKITATYKTDDKIVLSFYSDSRNVNETGVVIDTSDMSVSSLTLKFPAYVAKYYRLPDIFYMTDNSLIIGIANNGGGIVTMARMSKEDFFNNINKYEEIGTFRLM